MGPFVNRGTPSVYPDRLAVQHHGRMTGAAELVALVDEAFTALGVPLAGGGPR
jgi:hypothetical protein